MKWSPEISLDDLPGSLPPDHVPDDVDLDGISEVALGLLTNVTEGNLVQDAMWKDWLCLSGTVRTYNGASTVVQMWHKAVARKKATGFKTTAAKARRTPLATSWVTVDFEFVTTQEGGLVGVCSGSLGLVPVSGGKTWKIWYITSMLESFEGHGNPDTPVIERPYSGSMEDSSGEHEFEVVLIGAGQNSLAHAGRLQALGIRYVLLERLPGVGQSWTTKYDTVKQHTLKEYNNLPFDRTWDADDDDLLSAKRVTEGFQNFATKYNLNVWTSVDASVRSWDVKLHKWALDVVRNDGSGKKCTITCRHLAIGTGGGVSAPKRPHFPGEAKFRGDFVLAKNFRNSKKWKGKHGIVIGTGTTGHDIAQDMLDNGLSSITMIQRTKTAIFPIDWLIAGQEGSYNINFPTGVADRMQYTVPQKIGGEMMRRSFNVYMTKNKARFDAIERAGFEIDRDVVMVDKIVRQYGGYYIDIGTSDHIINGDIKVKSGVAISEFTEDGIAFADETEVVADVIVLAVGYEHDYRKQVATIVGDEIAEGMGEFWGLTEDGDMRGVMQESVPGLWLLAGTCGQARFWSRFVALKLQAELMGKPLAELSNDNEKTVVTNGFH